MTAERLNGADFRSSKSSFVQFSMEDQEHTKNKIGCLISRHQWVIFHSKFPEGTFKKGEEPSAFYFALCKFYMTYS